MAQTTDTPKGRGRPKAAEPRKVPVTTWVRPSEYDTLVKMANKRDENLSTLIRSLLKLRLP